MTRADRVGYVGRGQGAVSEELGCLEGVGEAGRGALSAIEAPAGYLLSEPECRSVAEIALGGALRPVGFRRLESD